MKQIGYGHVRRTGLPFDRAVQELEAALKIEGFGVLFQLDMQAKFREKLGVEFGRYIILGACKPAVAYEALQEEIGLGLLLPCNAVVFEHDGAVNIGVVDAGKMLSIVGNPSMAPMAQTVNESLQRAVDKAAMAAGSV
jgi:uncharacterized protein (DUF302 family)